MVPNESGRTQVVFNAPICIILDPPDRPDHVDPNHVKAFTYEEIRGMTKKYMEQGWDERAIVARAEVHRFNVSVPYNWGVVIDLNRTPMAGGTQYAPIKVRWIGSSTTSNHWPEELLLIHKSISMWELDQLVDAQEDT